MLYYDEPEEFDGHMSRYEGLDESVFQPPTDEEYREACAAYLKEQESNLGEEEQP